MRKWRIILLFLFIPLILRSQAQFPDYRGWVNDFADIMSPDEEQRIKLIAEELKVKTGAEVAVVTVQNMGGLEIEDYSIKLFESWGIGEKDRDNGALLILAVTERKVRIEVGYGLEPLLPDGLCGEILDTYVVPALRQNQNGQAFFQGMAAIAGVIAKDAGVQIDGSIPYQSGRRSSEGESGGGLFFIVIIIFLIIVTRGRIVPWLLWAMLAGGGGGRGGGSGGGSFGGGFGGFGGGMSGGGGASRGF